MNSCYEFARNVTISAVELFVFIVSDNSQIVAFRSIEVLVIIV